MAKLQAFNQIGLGKLSNGLYVAFLNVVSDFVHQASPEKLGILVPEFTSFQNLLAKLNDATLQVRKEELTKELEELDQKRDQLLRYLLGKILLDQQAPNVSIQKAAIALGDLREQYIETAKKGNLAETTEINGFVIDAGKAEYAAHFTTLGLTEAISILKKQNDAYKEKRESRIEKQATSPLLSVKELRLELDQLYMNMSMKAFALNIITPTAESESFVKKLNKLIADTNLAYRQHKAQIGQWTEE